MDIGDRLFRILKAATRDKLDAFAEIFEQGDSLVDEILRDWERKYDLGSDKQEDKGSFKQSTSYQDFQSNSGQRREEEPYSPFSQQLIEDLQLFNLSPPVTLEEVKKIRNQEIKKFHPDKFLQEPEKLETAKQILQIYNAAFERIKKELK